MGAGDRTGQAGGPDGTQQGGGWDRAGGQGGDGTQQRGRRDRAGGRDWAWKRTGQDGARRGTGRAGISVAPSACPVPPLPRPQAEPWKWKKKS